MDAKDSEFHNRLLATFRVEAEEHIRAVSAGLIELEKTREPEERQNVIENVFREVHSLKGAARSVSCREIESVCQPLESVFSALKRREISISPELCDLFHGTVDYIKRIASAVDSKNQAKDRTFARELIRKLGAASTKASAPEKGGELSQDNKLSTDAVESTDKSETNLREFRKQTQDEKSIFSETVRISIAKLDPLLLQAEEMILAKMSTDQQLSELKEINNALLTWQAESSRWKGKEATKDSSQRDELLEWTKNHLTEIQNRVITVTQALERDQRVYKRIAEDHLEAMKKVLMLPVASMTEAFPKLVRDLSRDQGKETDLVVKGAEIEIDKRVLDELKDPLIHLLRNCIDHGIKKPDERIRRNKPPRGTITLVFTAKDSRQFEILVSDDGSGIESEAVLSAAVKSGVISREAAEKINSRDLISLVFKSGITTSPIITDISGRGLGLAIVSEKVEKLGGTVSVDTKPGIGTIFKLLLPMTLATYRGVLIRVEENDFILPTINVERALRLDREKIKTVENRETIQLNGQIIPTVRLSDAMGISSRHNGRIDVKSAITDAERSVTIVVISSTDRRVAFQVDGVLGEQQILVKSFGRQLSRVRNIAGATILGNGKVVPVLNVSDLMKSALHVAASTGMARKDETIAKPGKILVTDDSITARTLIKNILETSGYQVTTAVDGIDAFTQLRTGEFDLLVSDVDMPRMNGFELTAKIRNDKKLEELPVVLVTALDSRDDRERGIEVGADAYIVKSSFDQSNLLEVINKLI